MSWEYFGEDRKWRTVIGQWVFVVEMVDDPRGYDVTAVAYGATAINRKIGLIEGGKSDVDEALYRWVRTARPPERNLLR